MLQLTREEIGTRAESLARGLNGSRWQARVIDGASTIGGGSAPGTEIPTRLVELTRDGTSAEQIEEHLRSLDPPLIARIVNDRVVLDLRTVAPGEDALVSRLLLE
jgi:L-seryl-tRNA(Ser) seleniumtransferase